MKKLSILFTFLFLTTILSAQFTVEDYDGMPIEDGDIRTFTSIIESEATLYFWINNDTSSDINMMIKNVSITNSDGSNFQFCFGTLCMFDVIEGETYPLSGTPEVIPAGGRNPQFDKFYNENPGDGTNYPIDYVFKFFEVDSNNNEIGNSITFTYRFDPTLSTSNFQLTDLGVLLNNTLVTGDLSITVKNPVSSEIYDLQGKLIQTSNLPTGNSLINVNSLKSGLYIIAFSDSNGKKATTKFVKK